MRDDLTAIAILPTMMDAQLVKTNLISHGIDAFIENEHTSSIAGGGEIRLFVNTKDSDRAIDIIESMFNENDFSDAGYNEEDEGYSEESGDDSFELEEEEERKENQQIAGLGIEEEKCPICSYPGFKTKGGKIVEALAEILPFFTITKKCSNCGYERPEKEDDRFNS